MLVSILGTFSGRLFGYYRVKFAGRDELLRELMNIAGLLDGSLGTAE